MRPRWGTPAGRGWSTGAAVCLLSAHLFLGISHVALLPPWEGFDESAHFSSVQHMADRWESPRLGVARLSTVVEHYARVAPMPYASVPPMEANGGLTYQAFFAGPQDTVARGAALIGSLPAEARRYEAGSGLNWEAQHPPLYYLILVPVYRLTRHLSLGWQLFCLRLVSYGLAWVALGLATWSVVWAIRARRLPDDPWIAVGPALWPLLALSWFPDMARLGNDSLCALIVAGLWLAFISALIAGLSTARAVVLGTLLGLGTLTKGLFVPVAAGTLAFWIARQARLVRRRRSPACWGPPLAMMVAALGVGGWWYLDNWRRTGVAIGSLDLLQLRQSGGLLLGLQRHFSVFEWLRGHADFLLTFAWSGTWSFARPPYITLAPLCASVLLGALAYVAALRRARAPTTELAWVPVWLTVPVLLGFSYHVLLRIALTGKGIGTPGYYLNFLVAPLGVALGLGLAQVRRRPGARAAAGALTLYGVLFATGISVAQILLFTGWLFKVGVSVAYQVPGSPASGPDVLTTLDRLAVLAFPRVGVAAWMSGAVLLTAGLGLAGYGTWRSSDDQGQARRVRPSEP